MSDTPSNPVQSGLSGISTSRRRILLGAAAVAAGAAASSGTAFAGSGHDHSHHGGNKNEGLIESALDCIKTGQLCMDHCIELFKSGDTSVAECADSVQEMLAMCAALSQMAASQSKHLPAVARICRDVCLSCEKECRKHEDKHAQCKACADSCRDCARECKKIAA